ncbi:MAG: tRNA threonylcarbamoyladenosine biosynthesis protein TsaB [Pseudonocardiales bacterium]|nr:tRNA threonylcarbamoyladenosine biosynthesis protein TsaB [Pseudonocardiales bacterium]
MLVLAIDTSSEAVTAAVVEVHGSEVIPPPVEVATINARGHGELLAPSIRQALEFAAASPDDLDAIVAGTGPGPYTGLRVGLVTAAVMGAALGIPTYGVCSLDAIAAAYESIGSLLVVTDARRKEVYWARYEDGVRIAGPDVDRPAEVPAAATVGGAGAMLYDFDGAFPEVRYPSAVALVGCALGRIRDHASSEVLTPLYLRRPDAVVPAAPKPVTP